MPTSHITNILGNRNRNRTNTVVLSMDCRFKIFASLVLLRFLTSQATTHQTYIVQLDPDHMTSSSFSTKPQWHASFLHQAISSEDETNDPSSRLLYSYDSAMEGFAARLSEPELDTLRKLPGVVAIRPDTRLETQTTYSYKFMGLSPARASPWYEAGFGRGTIIGVLDTGVWPESPSFDDKGMPPPPEKWKGICQEGKEFDPSTACNRKLIGARFFMKGHGAGSGPGEGPEYQSARDSHGHGSHTASTVAGAAVASAGVLENAAGVARGVAPMAHVAAYKVCWSTGCYSSDILAAMDAAIRDGVDVLSLSLGGFPIPLYADTIAIGSFRAVERGVSVVCAAGNNGPSEGSVANEAPWIATVGAGTMDRRFPAVVRLGTGERLYGESMYPGNRASRRTAGLELVYAAGYEDQSRFCLRGSLRRERVAGKMVVCDRGFNGRSEKGQVVKEAGGLAMVVTNTEINLEEDSVDVHVLPATLVGFDESVRLKAYINSTTNAPTARIEFGGTVIGAAPAVAEFSGRGPSFSNPSVLKPDMIAPGVNIVAAWPQNLGPTGLPEDRRRVNFTVMSGTSMSCPHVSGAAALLRAAHPRWTPAAVKSALMTTAENSGRSGRPIMDGDRPAGVFAVGAGHVSPGRALDPGLVYDIRPEDYVVHLCTLGYSNPEVFAVTHKNVSCRELLSRNRGFSLNYPSISAEFRGPGGKVIRRAVTNVGRAGSVYEAEVAAPEGVRVRVRPRRLLFTRVNQVLRYKIWLASKKRVKGVSHAQGHLTWVSDGLRYRVRSPISVTWKNK